jgi:molybdenum cofactor cytidylyltransferase
LLFGLSVSSFETLGIDRTVLNSKAKDQSPRTLDKVAAILLAAGRSERMGALKALLPFGEKTVVETCIDYLRKGGIRDIVVVLGHHAEKIRDQLRTTSVSFAVNPDPASEMNVSISCGVSALPLKAKAAVIALVDHPAIPAHIVAALYGEWSKGARLVVPTWKDRGGHPVLVDLSFREQLLSLDPGRGLKKLFDEHRNEVLRVAVDSPYVARDMDTWDDYRALYEEVIGTPPPGLALGWSNENPGGLI